MDCPLTQFASNWDCFGVVPLEVGQFRSLQDPCTKKRYEVKLSNFKVNNYNDDVLVLWVNG